MRSPFTSIGVFSTLVSAAFLSGCQIEKAPPPPSQEINSKWTKANSGAFVIQKDWWAQFGSPEFDSLVQTAVSKNLTLANLVARVKIADQGLRQSRLNGYPTLSATAGADIGAQGQSGSSMRTEQYSSGLQLSWEIDVWGRLRQATDAQLQEMRATESDWRAAYLVLIAQIGQSYIRLRLFDEQQAILKSAQERNEDILKITQARLKAGRGTIEQVRAQEAEVLRLVNNLEEARRQRQIESHALAEMLAMTPEKLLLERRPLRRELKIFKLPKDIQCNLLERRPDIIAANLRLKKSYRLKESAAAARLPKVTMGASLSAIKVPSTPSSWIATIAPKISFPSLDPATKTALNIKEVELDIARNDYKKSVYLALREVADAFVNHKAHAKQLSNETKRVSKLNEAHEKVKIRFREGRSSRLEVLESERQLLSAQQGELSQYAAVLQDLVAIHTALGGGWRAQETEED